jgi:hypothetical protein
MPSSAPLPDLAAAYFPFPGCKAVLINSNPRRLGHRANSKPSIDQKWIK